MTIPDPVRQWAERTPTAPAVVTASETWSWADLDARVSTCAEHLTASRVAVQAETSPAFAVLVLAALRAGRTLVPLSTRWPPAATAAALRRLGLSGALDADDLAEITTPSPAPGNAPVLDLERSATIVHTSGSTGEPKAVLHSVGNHVWSARGVNERMRLGEGDRWLLDLPLYHVGGLGVVVRCALAGAAVAVACPGEQSADVLGALRPTHVSLVATQLRRLLRAAPPEAMGSLRAVLLGGSAIPADLIDEAVGRGVPVATSYGMTEATATLTATAPGAARAALATSGQPLAHREMRIAEGEIEVSGPTRFVGYARAGGVDPAPAWFATGDLGRFDDAGRLVITGRRDLQFVSGGENVQPEAVEAALLALDTVAEAVVVPVPDAEFGARPVAFVRTSSGALDRSALAEALRQRVAGFAVPVAFHAWRGAGGMKPDRPALQAEAERRAAESSAPGPSEPEA